MSSSTTSEQFDGRPQRHIGARIPALVDMLLVGAPVPQELFAEGATVAIPDESESETAARITIDPGSRAALRRPVGRVTLAARQNASLLVEGVRERVREPVGTFVASVRFGPDGKVARYLEFGCRGARDPLPDDADGDLLGEGAVADVVDRYFHALDVGNFSGAAACFTDDVLYSHPPYRHTGIDGHQRVEFRGRAELLAAFQRRGRTTFDHHVSVYAQHGAHGLIEGRVDGLPDGRFGSFVSSLSLDAAGRIRRYVSFYCEPGIAP